MKGKRKKRYFCDFWDKFASSENYERNMLFVFCVVYGIFAILEFIIFLALIDDVDIRIVASTAIITTGIIMAILNLLC